MKITIFYSWQSDLPNRTNRGFIEQALEKAIKAIRSSSVVEKDERPSDADIVIDRDAQGIAGSPDIAHTIFDKIQNASAFVGDVSIINNHLKALPSNAEVFRSTPNPNVLIELGYAANHLGWGNIICVFNDAFGAREELPFDLRPRRILSYCAARTQDEIAKERDSLAKQLEVALQAIVNTYEAKGKDSIIIPLRGLLEELEHNAQLASGASWEQRSGKFRDPQYARSIEQGILSTLPDDLRGQIRNAYAACDNANGFIEAVRYQPQGGNAWAMAVNAAEPAIGDAKDKIDIASSELKKYLESFRR